MGFVTEPTVIRRILAYLERRGVEMALTQRAATGCLKSTSDATPLRHGPKRVGVLDCPISKGEGGPTENLLNRGR